MLPGELFFLGRFLDFLSFAFLILFIFLHSESIDLAHCPRLENRIERLSQSSNTYMLFADLGRQITRLFFSLWKITLYEIFVLIFY